MGVFFSTPARLLYVVCFLVKSLTDLPELNYMSTHGGGDGGVANGGCRYEFTPVGIRHNYYMCIVCVYTKFCMIFGQPFGMPIYQS